MEIQVLLLEPSRKPPKVWIGFNWYRARVLTVPEARELRKQLDAVLAPAGKKGRKK